MILFFMFSFFLSYTLLEKRDNMEKKVTFEKELSFPNEIAEVTSISLDQDLQLENYTVEGNFTISGTYQRKDTLEKEDFHEIVPCTIALDTKYDVSQMSFDIDDFYYQIPSSHTVLVHIDVMLQNLIEKEEDMTESIRLDESDLNDSLEREEKLKEPVTSMEHDTELLELPYEDLTSTVPKQETNSPEAVIFPSQPIPVEVSSTAKEETTDLPSIFSNLTDTSDTFCKYHVYIMRETDTLETVLTKYQTNRDALAEYNNLESLPVGTKLIIPSNHE